MTVVAPGGGLVRLRAGAVEEALVRERLAPGLAEAAALVRDLELPGLDARGYHESVMRPARIGPGVVTLALACTAGEDGSGASESAATEAATSAATFVATSTATEPTTGASATESEGDLIKKCPFVNRQDFDADGHYVNYLYTQEDVEKLAGCTHMDDSLRIDNSIVDLTPLASLRHVGGTLTIYGGSHSPMHLVGANSLAGLEGLRFVGGLVLDALRIGDVAPLAGLTEIPGDLQLRGLWALQSLEGLHNVGSVGGALVVDDCGQLHDLEGLRGLERVGVRVFFGELPITNFQGLEALTEVGTPGGESRVGLYYLGQLTSLDGLAIDWGPDHEVWIAGTPISDLGVFAGVDELKALQVGWNNTLTGLGGLESLRVVHGELRLERNTSLTELSALASLEAVGALTIVSSALTELVIPALQEPGDVRISDNEQLGSLAVLTGVTTLRSLVLEFNPMLTGVPELAGLVAVEGDLELRTNAGMTGLSDLAALASVGGRLAVTYNPEILQTEAEAWAGPIAVGGVRKIVGNKGYEVPPLDPCPWMDDGECDNGVCTWDGWDCLSD